MEGWVVGVWMDGWMNGWTNQQCNKSVKGPRCAIHLWSQEGIMVRQVYGTSLTQGANTEMFSWSTNGSGFATSEALWKVNQDRCNPPKYVASFGTKVSFVVVGVIYIFLPYDPNIKDVKGGEPFSLGHCLTNHILTTGWSHTDG